MYSRQIAYCRAWCDITGIQYSTHLVGLCCVKFITGYDLKQNIVFGVSGCVHFADLENQ